MMVSNIPWNISDYGDFLKRDKSECILTIFSQVLNVKLLMKWINVFIGSNSTSEWNQTWCTPIEFFFFAFDYLN